MHCCCLSKAWLLQHLAGMPAHTLYKPLSCAQAFDAPGVLLQGHMGHTAAQVLGLGIEARHSYTGKPSGLLLLLAKFIVAELCPTI